MLSNDVALVLPPDAGTSPDSKLSSETEVVPMNNPDTKARIVPNQKRIDRMFQKLTCFWLFLWPSTRPKVSWREDWPSAGLAAFDHLSRELGTRTGRKS